MRYFIAIFASIFMFVATFILVGLVLYVALPIKITQVGFNLGSLKVNLPSLVSLVISSLVATNTFKSSLNAKTGKLFKKHV